MANNGRDPQREQFWRETIKRQTTSGLSVREFCRREQLAETSFFAWRRTIRQRDAEQRGCAQLPRSRPALGVFRNKGGHLVKVLWWDREGLAIYSTSWDRKIGKLTRQSNKQPNFPPTFVTLTLGVA